MSSLEANFSSLHWYGSTLNPDEWRFPLSVPEQDEIHQALRFSQNFQQDIYSLTKDDFPLPLFQKRLRYIQRHLEEGCGVALLTGVPLGELSASDVTRMYWGLGLHLGTAVNQSRKRDKIGYVSDKGVDIDNPTVRGYESRAMLPFHSDRCDVIGLLCVRPAHQGGQTLVASAFTVHQEIAIRYPNLLPVLYSDFPNDQRGEERPGQPAWIPVPIFSQENGFFVARYVRRFIEATSRHVGAPLLSSTQLEALNGIDEVLKDPKIPLLVTLQTGDLLLLNNFVSFHSRTEFLDADNPQEKRLLLRLWLSVPNSRPLPESFRPLYDNINAGAVRGGVWTES